jgi:hypothetical protein
VGLWEGWRYETKSASAARSFTAVLIICRTPRCRRPA